MGYGDLVQDREIGSNTINKENIDEMCQSRNFNKIRDFCKIFWKQI